MNYKKQFKAPESFTLRDAMKMAREEGDALAKIYYEYLSDIYYKNNGFKENENMR